AEGLQADITKVQLRHSRLDDRRHSKACCSNSAAATSAALVKHCCTPLAMKVRRGIISAGACSRRTGCATEHKEAMIVTSCAALCTDAPTNTATGRNEVQRRSRHEIITLFVRHMDTQSRCNKLL
ncbi:unnamed protein product, partial [Ectocarpus sp. 12 AP-2014]